MECFMIIEFVSCIIGWDEFEKVGLIGKVWFVIFMSKLRY